jgi:hypothetical protein
MVPFAVEARLEMELDVVALRAVGVPGMCSTRAEMVLEFLGCRAALDGERERHRMAEFGRVEKEVRVHGFGIVEIAGSEGALECFLENAARLRGIADRRTSSVPDNKIATMGRDRLRGGGAIPRAPAEIEDDGECDREVAVDHQEWEDVRREFEGRDARVEGADPAGHGLPPVPVEESDVDFGQERSPASKHG